MAVRHPPPSPTAEETVRRYREIEKLREPLPPSCHLFCPGRGWCCCRSNFQRARIFPTGGALYTTFHLTSKRHGVEKSAPPSRRSQTALLSFYSSRSVAFVVFSFQNHALSNLSAIRGPRVRGQWRPQWDYQRSAGVASAPAIPRRIPRKQTKPYAFAANHA